VVVAAPTTLVAERVGFSWSRRTLIRELSLDVAGGEIVSILGPNGCGKTTLLRCLSGGLRLERGTVLLNGADVRFMSAREIALRLALLAQERTFGFAYTAFDVVMMGRAPHLGWLATPGHRDAEIVHAALAAVGMETAAHRPVSRLSGGEGQLVLLARALAQESPILLLDEPTAHLDLSNAMHVLQTVKELAAERAVAVVLTTHSPNETLFAADRVALMRDGGFIAEGTPRAVLTEANLERLYETRIRVVDLDPPLSDVERFVVPLGPAPAQPASDGP
jgi:iron complex transport system ATP-binding protein